MIGNLLNTQPAEFYTVDVIVMVNSLLVIFHFTQQSPTNNLVHRVVD